MGTGQEFAKKVGAAGCVLILALSVLATAMLFTVKGAPVKDYAPEKSGEYYAGHPEELLAEIEDRLLPKIDAPGVGLELVDGVIAVTGPAKELQTARLAIIYYFDEDLFEFTEVTP